MPTLEELQQRQQAAATQSLQFRQRVAREGVDDTGAPGFIRGIVGSISDPVDRLATLRQTFPDAQRDPADPNNFIFTNPETGRLTRYNPRGLDFGDIPSITREASQAAGGALGAIAGAPLGLGGAVAGATLGTMAGEEFANIIGQAFGAQDTRSLTERVGETGAIGAFGAAGEAGGAVLGKLGTQAVKRIFRGGSGPEVIQQAIDDLAPSGATPTVGQATKNSVIDAFESQLAKFPGGQTVMRDVAENTSQKVGEQIARVAQRTAGDIPVERLDPEFAGRTIQEGIEGFAKRFQRKSAELFNDLGKEIPADRRVQVNRTVSELADLSQEIIPAQRIPEIANRLQGRLGPDGTLDFRSLQRLRSEVGRRLGDATLVSDVPRGDLKKLYGAITDDLRSAAAKEGDITLRKFERANEFYKKGIKVVDKQLEPIVRNKVPEKIFKALETGGRDGATNIRTVRQALTPNQWKVIQGTAIRRLGRETPGQAVEGGEFSFNRFLTNWNSLDDLAKRELFSGEFRKDLDQIVRAAQRLRETSGAFANPSGTSQAIAQSGGFFAAGSLAAGNMTLPLMYGAATLGANRAAKLMTSPRFVRWLAKGTEISPRGAAAHIGQLAGIAQAADFETKVAIFDYLDSLEGVIPPEEPKVQRRVGLGQ